MPTSWSSLTGLQLIEDVTKRADDVQAEVLSEILDANAGIQYFKSFGITGSIDRETFRSTMPVVTYKDIRPLIERIADGDCSAILSSLPITTFLISSGTSSGEPKLIPSSMELIDRGSLALGLTSPLVNQHFEGMDKGKGLNFMFTRAETRTRGGIAVQTVVTYLHKTDSYQNRIETTFTSPIEVVLCTDSFQSMYAQMLCGLYARKQVFWVEKLFAYGLIRAIKFLEQNWRHLTHDIRTGSLDVKVTDPAIRKHMERVSRPDPALADSIARECAKNDWAGIVPRIWPHTKCLKTIVTGPMAQYIPTLDYYSGGLPILSLAYASSECVLGLNLDPVCDPSEVSYTFMPFMAYFEFLPIELDPSKPTTDDHRNLVDLVNVEIGKEYEVVVTTGAGLYRYRLGDIVRAVGFYNSAPKFRFVMRRDVALNIDWENTKETELHAAVQNAARLLLPCRMKVLDYTSRVDPTTVPAHYVVYLELLKVNDGSVPSDEAVWGECCLAMEESFNWVYCLLRDSSIGPLEIRVVRDGSFEALMEVAVTRDASIGQFKMPRCVRVPEMIELLDARVVASHFRSKLSIRPTEPRY